MYAGYSRDTTLEQDPKSKQGKTEEAYEQAC